jgi:DNA repair exonuclease SbcCD ATPase subunit
MMDSGLVDRLALLSKSVDRVKTFDDFLGSKASKCETEVSELRDRSDLYVKCSEIFKRWLEDSVEKNINSIADLSTEGLRHIINDQSLQFSIRQESKLNRVSMRFVVEQDGVEGDPLASFGGGAAVVVSLILRLAVMQRIGCSNLLILDESMVALANAYVPSAAEFMRRLSEETGVNILMVTHNPEFLSHAHVSYEGHKDASLRLKRLNSTVTM